MNENKSDVFRPVSNVEDGGERIRRFAEGFCTKQRR